MPAAAPARTDASEVTRALREVEASVARVIRGKPEAIRLCLTALIARGHILIEDIPGVGKTTLARALAAALGGSFRRIQFTSDLLPSDILGVTVYRSEEERFAFRRGPIFANVVLADEINRTTPRTQSALLEAMSEGKVSVDDHTHELEPPFLVLATQNPVEHFGTYPLPDSQMDRFLLRIRLGYPERSHEREILRELGGKDPVANVAAEIDGAGIRALQDRAESVRVGDELLEYAMDVVDATRKAAALSIGVSTRGALAWYRAAQAHALISGRDYCVPDDFKELAQPALGHRIVLSATYDTIGRARAEAERTISDILTRTAAPG